MFWIFLISSLFPAQLEHSKAFVQMLKMPNPPNRSCVKAVTIVHTCMYYSKDLDFTQESSNSLYDFVSLTFPNKTFLSVNFLLIHSY